jgi:hypothetical protein
MGHVVRMTATGALGITFIFLVDATNLFWVSQLGNPQLVAAIGFAYAVQFFSVSVAVGLMIAATALISRSVGRGEADLARRQAGAACVIAVALMCIVVALIVGFRHALVGLAGAEGETARLAARYLASTVPSLLPMCVALVLSGTLRAYGYGAKAMYITMFSGFVLLVLDPILILYLRMGLDGAAIGLVLFRIFRDSSNETGDQTATFHIAEFGRPVLCCGGSYYCNADVDACGQLCTDDGDGAVRRRGDGRLGGCWTAYSRGVWRIVRAVRCNWGHLWAELWCGADGPRAHNVPRCAGVLRDLYADRLGLDDQCDRVCDCRLCADGRGC